MILPILPDFKFDLDSLDIQDEIFYFSMSLHSAEIQCECVPQVKNQKATIAVNPWFDEDIDFDNRVVTTETVITIHESTEDNLIGLQFGLTEEQLTNINLVLEEYFLDLHIETEKEKAANDY